jgi:anti-sigma28 factor (negative regulator of flagellin synthesis)
MDLESFSKSAPHPLSREFYGLLTEAAEMHARKQADYGTATDPFANVRASEDFGIPSWVGAILRGNDKVARIKAFIRNGNLKNESVEDSLLDLIVYSGIALVLYREERQKQ